MGKFEFEFMVQRSLQASTLGISEKTFKRKEWTQEYLASEVGLKLASQFGNFSGKPIERHIFLEI